MNLFRAIKHLYPDLESDKDFILKDDGNGPYILKWDNERVQPLQEDLEAAWEKIKDIPIETPLSELDQLKKQHADLIFELVLNGVL